jgi:hypothetical protein
MIAVSQAQPGIGARATMSGMVAGIAMESLSTISSGSYDTVMVYVQPQFWMPAQTPESLANMAPTSSEAPATSTWNQLFSKVLTMFKDLLNIEFGDGLIRALNIEAENVEAQSGVTTYDHVTGEPYCMFVSEGQMRSVPGKCNQESPTGASQYIPQPNPTPPSTDSEQATPSPTELPLTDNQSLESAPSPTPEPTESPPPDSTTKEGTPETQGTAGSEQVLTSDDTQPVPDEQPVASDEPEPAEEVPSVESESIPTESAPTENQEVTG